MKDGEKKARKMSRGGKGMRIIETEVACMIPVYGFDTNVTECREMGNDEISNKGQPSSDQPT